MILHLPYHSHTTCSAVQGVPDFQKDGFTVRPPLMVPKTQFLDAS